MQLVAEWEGTNAMDMPDELDAASRVTMKRAFAPMSIWWDPSIPIGNFAWDKSASLLAYCATMDSLLRKQCPNPAAVA
jgi:hypothetical protein